MINSDSYSDAATLASLQYEMHLSERGQKVESVQRMTATGKEPASPDATRRGVLPGTRDPLGLMQYLRNVDWTKTPEVAAGLRRAQTVRCASQTSRPLPRRSVVPAGDYTASKIGIRVFDDAWR